MSNNRFRILPVRAPKAGKERRLRASGRFASMHVTSMETRADRQILERLMTAFESEMAILDISAVRFFVRNRVVTVNGLIRTEADHESLLSVIRETSGVERVIDRLHTAPKQFALRALRRSA